MLPHVIFWLAVIANGLALGSFIACAVYRVPRGLSVWKQGKGDGSRRSYCPQCHHMLSWYDLIPVLSWVLLRGRCRYCQATIPARYPLIELGVTALTIIIAMGLKNHFS